MEGSVASASGSREAYSVGRGSHLAVNGIGSKAMVVKLLGRAL